jgi:hypothetical protein
MPRTPCSGVVLLLLALHQAGLKLVTAQCAPAQERQSKEIPKNRARFWTGGFCDLRPTESPRRVNRGLSGAAGRGRWALKQVRLSRQHLRGLCACSTAASSPCNECSPLIAAGARRSKPLRFCNHLSHDRAVLDHQPGAVLTPRRSYGAAPGRTPHTAAPLLFSPRQRPPTSRGVAAHLGAEQCTEGNRPGPAVIP